MQQAAMNEVLTMSEIESRYRDQWILIEEPQTNEAHEVLAGKVRCHSRNRDDIDRSMMEIPPPRQLAIVYTGRLPANSAVVL
jgi:hypothetical protein